MRRSTTISRPASPQAIDGTTPPSAIDMSGIIIYFGVLVLMSLLDLAMFAINAFGFVGYAIFALFGPLFIPLLLTRNFAGKFWVWLDGLITFGMYQAVAGVHHVHLVARDHRLLRPIDRGRLQHR